VTKTHPNRWWSHLTAPWNIQKLRQESLDYWHDQRPGRQDAEKTSQEWYIAQLLPQELYHATQKHELCTDLHCDTLALLVGYSIEPLLQTISVYEPAYVILLLHKQYGEETGKQRGLQVKTWITDLLGPHLARQPQVQVAVIAQDEFLADKPETVFRALCEYVLPHQRAGQRVVVDITGGKKSMDAGAFLFAAYADIPVSYVDFDEYHPKERRPFGFTCRIGELENPYAAFRLRDWERVRRLYEDYHFRAAGETLREVLQVMHAPAFAPEHIQATQRLLEILRLYEAWDDGDYHAAQAHLRIIHTWAAGFSAPDAITALGPHWPELHQAIDERQAFARLVDTSGWRSAPKTPKRSAFFESNTQLLSYAWDELAKIQRLKDHNEDPRSALLRAAGLDELLLKARWSKLYKKGQLRTGSSSGPLITPDIYEQLLNHSNVDFMRENLRRGGLSVQIGYKKSVTVYPASVAPRLADYEHDLPLAGQEIADLRNQTIHQYIPIPQSVAEAAYRLAKANLDDFVAYWATLDDQEIPVVDCVTRMEWDDVCRLCGLDFLPLWQKEQP